MKEEHFHGVQAVLGGFYAKNLLDWRRFDDEEGRIVVFFVISHGKAHTNDEIDAPLCSGMGIPTISALI